MKTKLLFLLLIIPLLSLTQETDKPILYLDENMSQIDMAKFYVKSKSLIFHEEIVLRDSIKIKYLIKDYDFKKLDDTELTQIQGVFKSFYNTTDLNKNLIITYKDTIMGFEEYSKSLKHRKSLDEAGNVSYKKYLKNRKTTDEIQKKCNRFLKRNNSLAIHFYSVNQNFTYNIKHYSFQKINKVLKNTFFKNKSSGIIILKPNGHYFYYRYLPEHQVEKMLNKNWREYISDFNQIDTNPQIFETNFILKARIENKNRLIAIGQAQVEREREREKRLKTNNIQRNRRVTVNQSHCFISSRY
ncbi:hypothetical protein [Winogradskyella immobilis]|uniref:Uncharacterized protein n=1 Tax=Winogradskyella immobilis TaxID=2816852 RepID=A0ABS8ENQ6_9FLAO|nr:hypothetical protein [Winogradskyella immobilis]MCC1484834.1 hypothetical protein [Winogradskyella immobilis]MCG0016926.1 hypothetical protein [Winogradskyella immobilis]